MLKFSLIVFALLVTVAGRAETVFVCASTDKVEKYFIKDNSLSTAKKSVMSLCKRESNQPQKCVGPLCKNVFLPDYPRGSSTPHEARHEARHEAPSSSSCSAEGLYCNHSGQCCGGAICSGNTCQSHGNSCKPEGGFCGSSGDCCGSLGCIQGRCTDGHMSGFPAGARCETSGECRGSLGCIQNRCQ